jgi:hypothetical protein
VAGAAGAGAAGAGAAGAAGTGAGVAGLGVVGAGVAQPIMTKVQISRIITDITSFLIVIFSFF